MADPGAMLESSSAAAAPAPRSAGNAHSVQRIASPRYVACLSLLVFSAIGTHLSAAWLQAYFEKQPLPLKAHLYRMDATKLRPYRLAAQQPPPLSPETIESLGTEDYLNWVLVDPLQDPTSPTYSARLFITYYTGKPDLVPHEPRECMQAAGWELATERSFPLDLPDPLAGSIAAPVAMLGFDAPGGGDAPSGPRPRLHVMYFFNANGLYRTDRTGVRLAVSNLTDRYAFYTKIEISFTDERGTRLPGEAEAEAAARRLLPPLMKILWADHLPDWADARRTPATANQP